MSMKMNYKSIIIFCFFIGLLCCVFFNNVQKDRVYLGIHGDTYFFHYDNQIIQTADSFTLITKCNYGQFCIQFDETTISIPKVDILNKAKKTNYFEHKPFNDKSYIQAIEYKKINILELELEGFYIMTYKDNISSNLKDVFFYNEDKGLIFLTYRYKFVDLFTGKEGQTLNEFLILQGEKGIYAN